MYMKVCASMPIMPFIQGARYTSQSGLRTRTNLSSPNRIGATVKTVRNSRKACRYPSCNSGGRATVLVWVEVVMTAPF